MGVDPVYIFCLYYWFRCLCFFSLPNLNVVQTGSKQSFSCFLLLTFALLSGM